MQLSTLPRNLRCMERDTEVPHTLLRPSPAEALAAAHVALEAPDLQMSEFGRQINADVVDGKLTSAETIAALFDHYRLDIPAV